MGYRTITIYTRLQSQKLKMYDGIQLFIMGITLWLKRINQFLGIFQRAAKEAG